jgi:tetratricopeptide (TPR) repeat protein
VGEVLEQEVTSRGVAGARRKWGKLRATNYGGYYLSEMDLNRVGYIYLNREPRRVEAAIAIFEANVEAFPQSANVYDSLGEALMVAGQKDRAIANYRRSLELDPTNSNARAMLEKLTK